MSDSINFTKEGLRMPTERQYESPEGRVSIEQQIRDLQAAHWIPHSASVWIAPNGAMFRGPHGAWKAMKAMERMNHQRAV